MPFEYTGSCPVSCSSTRAARVKRSPDSPTQQFKMSLLTCEKAVMEIRSRHGYRLNLAHLILGHVCWIAETRAINCRVADRRLKCPSTWPSYQGPSSTSEASDLPAAKSSIPRLARPASRHSEPPANPNLLNALATLAAWRLELFK